MKDYGERDAHMYINLYSFGHVKSLNNAAIFLLLIGCCDRKIRKHCQGCQS